MYLLAALVLAICCAAPLVIAAALTGLATGLAVAGWPAAALAVAAIGIVVIGLAPRSSGLRASRPSAAEVKRND